LFLAIVFLTETDGFVAEGPIEEDAAAPEDDDEAPEEDAAAPEDDDEAPEDDDGGFGFNDPLGLPAFPRGSCVFSGLSFNSNKSDFEFLVFFLKLVHQ